MCPVRTEDQLPDRPCDSWTHEEMRPTLLTVLKRYKYSIKSDTT